MNIEYFKTHQPERLDLDVQLSSLSDTFVLFDLETTGFFADKDDQVTQIGAAIVNGSDLSVRGKPLNLRVKLSDHHLDILKKELNRREPPGYQSAHWILALNNYHPVFKFTGEKAKTTLTREDETTYEFEYDVVSRITKDQLQQVIDDQLNLPSERVALSQFLGWIEENGATVALGHNAQLFDKAFLNYRLEEVYGLSKFNYPIIDTMWLARLLFVPALYTLQELGVAEAQDLSVKLAKGKNLENLSSKLQDLKAAFNLTGGLAHDAAGDVTTNLSVLIEIIAFLGKYSDTLKSSAKFVENKRLCFAKHKSRDFKY